MAKRGLLRPALTLSLVRRPQEDLHGFAQALHELIVAHGLPETLYGDHTGIAVRNDDHWSLEEELAGRQQPTQFGQMLDGFGVHYIAAHSPEAKGRIERHWQTRHRIRLRTTNVIERYFREVRRRVRPMTLFANPKSCNRIIFAIFSRLNTEWLGHRLPELTQRA